MALGVGTLITFEGAEGSGKSTQIELAHQYLKESGKDVLLLREPGGVKISEMIREILLDPSNKQMGKECETLLYMAARAQLVAEVLMPALDEGKIVICDRFLDSTVVYQGYGAGVNIQAIEAIGTFATSGREPDVTFLFDIDAEQGLSRIQREKDRIEQRPLEYHQKVREGYLSLAKMHGDRINVVQVGERTKEEIWEEVKHKIDEILAG